MRQCAVICAAVVFQPYGVVRILVQVLGANPMVLALDHVAQTREELLYHVCVLAVVAVNFGVVHANHVKAHVQNIPV